LLHKTSGGRLSHPRWHGGGAAPLRRNLGASVSGVHACCSTTTASKPADRHAPTEIGGGVAWQRAPRNWHATCFGAGNVA
jgi:hypothetical protein